MNKAILILGLLVGFNVKAGPRVIGNGGDVIEENPVSVNFIQNLIPGARLFIVAWLHGLEGQIAPDDGLKGRNPRQLPIPLGAEKLFQSGPRSANIYDKINQIKINFKTTGPCGANAHETDGSVSPERPSEICISGSNLARKLNEGNAKIQLEALIVHELSHLLGTTENEAQSIQSQYIEDMRVVSKESITKYAAKVLETIHTVKVDDVPKMILAASNEATLCPLITEVRSQLEAAFTYSEVTPISLFSASNRDLADALTTFEGQMLHLYVCGRNQSHPIPSWVAEYEKGFAGKNTTSLADWMTNRGVKGILKTSASLIAIKINNKEDLLQEINTLPYMAEGLQLALISDLLSVFEIQLDEKVK